VILAAFLWGCGRMGTVEGSADAGATPDGEVARPADAPTAGPLVDVVLLGTGTPIPDPQRQGAATAVVVDGLPLIFDAGPGVVRQAQAAADRHSLSALAPENLRHVFLTHLHSDHTTGLPDLLLGAWVLGRSASIRVVGPPGTQAMVDGILAGWQGDIAIRQGVEDLPPSGLRVEVVEVEGGVVFREEGLEVRAVKVPHGTWEVALGFVVQAGPRRVVISGDTAPSEALVSACDGCDLLVHEVYSKQGFDRVPSASFQRYHSTFHTSGVELGALATRAKAQQVVLTHQLFFGASEAQVVGEVQQGFAGPVTSGDDLERFRVGP
jgi:ribonuclease Z